MLYKVFDFASKEVSAVMVPRPEVVGIAVDIPRTGSPRGRRLALHALPVYRGSLDDVVGILHVRDLFGAMHDVASRPSGSNPSCARLRRTGDEGPRGALADFRREKQHMAIVIDGAATWRGSSPSRICSSRSSVTSRTSSTSGHLHRADRREPHPHRRDRHDRRFQRGVRNGARGGGLPHDGRARLRRARAGAGGWGLRSHKRAPPDRPRDRRAPGSLKIRSRVQGGGRAAERRTRNRIGNCENTTTAVAQRPPTRSAARPEAPR